MKLPYGRKRELRESKSKPMNKKTASRHMSEGLMIYTEYRMIAHHMFLLKSV